MTLVDLYVESELRQIKRDSDFRGAMYRQEWFETVRRAASPARTAARWTGDRLVRAGERLRSWSDSTSRGGPTPLTPRPSR